MLSMSDSITMLSDMKTNQSIRNLQARIAQVKSQLQAQGPMRPGSLSRHYNVCGKPGCRCKDPQQPRRHGPYYQLNYVFRGKKTSLFIPRQQVAQLRAQLANYKTLRRSTDQWIGLAIQIAKMKRKLKT